MSRVPRLLVVSPIASHPADQGNAARIAALGAALMARGIRCEFLHFATEGAAPSAEAAMARFWHALHTEPGSAIGEPSLPGVWGIDDWCPESLVERLAALQRTRRYDAVLVNYVWLSRALEGAGDAFRILDTHDLFGGRDAVARDQGLDPSWFFTTIAKEGRGLARADLVLGIQAEEAAALARRGAREVMLLSHMPPLRFLDRPAGPPAGTAFGYFGSANPWNLAAVRALDAALAAAPDLPWLLAGRILRRADLRLASRPRLMPELRDVAGFYAAVDCVLNPLAGGTGLKVKTVEALAFGNPVLGTVDAFAGLPAEHPGHACADLPALLTLMRECRRSGAFRRELRQASRLLALRHAADVSAAQDVLAARLRALAA
ncbi:glycosyltransferase [Belnapia sp. T6]|uniref:Glycosyltransferase n=1 Tax=Belnapia mucosa TaxID=2804532 RepID=A0ABS1V5C2_9PROT|nr:glycosyltransferase [Belnapia mucosa]MBL6456856.1 glycosyltransferase [Belnapia mucosa]